MLTKSASRVQVISRSRTIPLDYTGTIQGNFLAFSPDGQILTANDIGPGLRCWRVPTLAEIDAAELKERAEVTEP